MKKSNRTSARFARFIKCLFASKAYEHMIFANQLPMTIKSFVQNHFTGQSISFVEESANATGYVLSLNNGSEVSINQNGSWNKVAFQLNSMPASLFPNSLTTYLRNHFPSNSFVEIQRTPNSYKTFFSSRNAMVFDNEGQPVVQ